MKRSVLAFACLLVACASSHAARERAQENAGEAGVYFQGEGPFAPVAEEEFGEALGAALLHESERCCQQLGLPLEAAASRFAGLQQAFVPADPESGARYQPAAAAACVASHETRACQRSKDTPSPAANPCQALYLRGSRRAGEPCSSPWDCASDGPDTVAVCSGDRCALQRVVRAGELCTSSDLSAQCAPQLFCDPTRNECVARAALGQPCVTGASFGDTCAEGAVCDRRGSKRCVKPRPAGEGCSALEECEDLACLGGVCREPLAIHPICLEARPGPLRR